MIEYTAEVTQWGAVDDISEERAYSGRLYVGELVFKWLVMNYGLGRDGNKSRSPNANGSKTTMYNPQGKRVAWADSKDAPAVRRAINKAINEAHRLCRSVRDVNGDPTSYSIDIEPGKVLFRYGTDDKPTEYQRRQNGSVIIPT